MHRNYTDRGPHDLGGMPELEISATDHDYALWEKRVDAIMMLLTNKLELITVDELRKGIEALPPDAYKNMTYYERWIASITHALLNLDVITVQELGIKMEEAKALNAASEGDVS